MKSETDIKNKLSSISLAACALLCLVPTGCDRTNPTGQTATASPRTIVQKPVVSNASNPETTSQLAKKNPTLNIPTAENKPAIEKQATSPEKKETVTVKKVPVISRNGKTYHPGSLHKNNTTLVLVYQNDIRADYLIMDKRFLLDEDQVVKAKQIGMEHDRDFQHLLDKRNRLLEAATSTEEFEAGLLEVKMDTADLISKIRSRVYVEILTPEQIVQLKAKYANDKK